jgi:hypothetical protein
VYADAGKGVAHFIELEGFYDSDNQLHVYFPRRPCWRSS